MKKLFNHILTDTMATWGFSLSFVFIIFSIGFVTFFYKSLPPFLPLYNKLPWGYARLGTRPEIFIPIAIAFILLIINLIISNRLYVRTVLLARCLCATTLILSLAVAIYIVQIILLIK